MSRVQIHRGRYNQIPVNLQINITGDTITSQIRERPHKSSTLIATWTIAVTDATNGLLTVTIDDSSDDQIAGTKELGFMDFKRIHGGHEVPVLNRPIEVEIIGSVTP